MAVSQEVLFKIITPKLIITESIDSPANAKIILEELQIYEDFMNSIKQFLGSRFDDTIKDVGQNIVNMKDAGVLIKNVISDADYLTKVSDQMSIELKNMISELRSTVNTFISKLDNTVKQSGIIQTISKVINTITTQFAKLATFDGWKKFLYSLGMYSFTKFIILKFTEYNIDQLINFFTGGAPEILINKIAEFASMIISISSTTMTEFLGFFKSMVQVGSIMISVLSYIRKKIDIGNNLNLKAAPDVKLEEDGGVGKIVKGENTTPDVGPNEISKQAKKFGNNVDKNGRPPLLNKKMTQNTTSHNLYNIGLAEKYSAIELAIMEGGHSMEPNTYVDEGVKDTLKKAAMIGAVGAVGLGAYGTKNTYDREFKNNTNIQQTTHGDSNFAPTSSIRPISKKPTVRNNTTAKAGVSASTTAADVEITSKLAPKTSIMPRPRTTLTDTSYEKYFISIANKNGIKGDELIALLAQVAHETDYFKTLVEYDREDNFKSYEGKNGNTDEGDGYKYRGRGFLQLTGKENYQLAGDFFGLDLVNDPDLVSNPKIAAATSLWYWVNRVKPHVKDWSDVTKVTKKVNGSNKGLEKREELFSKYADLFNRSDNQSVEENKVEQRLFACESNENNTNLIDLSSAREKSNLQKFHKDFMNKIYDGANEMQAVLDTVHDMGLFNDLSIGTRIKLSKGGPYKVIGFSLKSAKTDEIPPREKEFRKLHNFGNPLFIKGETKYYSPMVYLEELSGEMAGSKGAFQLDKLVNFDTNEKRYSKYTGPVRIEETNQSSYGYKVMAYDPTSKTAHSLVDKTISIPLIIGTNVKMANNGIYLSNNENFVKTYYSGLTDHDEIIIKFMYDPKDIISGNDSDSESEFTVSNAKIVGFKII